MKYIKKIIIWGIVAAVFYFVLSTHFIIIGSKIKFLKKSGLTLNYTIFSIKGKTNAKIFAIDALREDGIGELLVETGMMSEAELELLIAKYEESDSY